MFKKNKKQIETIKEPKEKKVRTVKVGTHKKTVIALWVVLIASVSFGVLPTSSKVTDVIVWSIEQSGTDTFSATYEVDQQIKEGEQTSNVKATYTVKVHVDADGDNVKVKVAVKFLDNQTKATQVSQYELVLHKDSNWKIVG